MLSSEIIRRVKQIQLRTGRPVADVLAGEYVSVFKGSGVEFDEVRPYVPGDDVRTIDWNVTARAGEPFVKRYVEERQLNLLLMADISPSQTFGSQRRTKREATAELCALLAFTAIRSDDKVGLVLFHGAVEQFIPPRKGQRHALRVVREVLAHRERIEDSVGASPVRRLRDWLRSAVSARERRRLRGPGQTTDIAGAMEFVLSTTRRRSMCFVVSDFFDQEFEQALSMANRRHDVIAVLVSDPHEFEMPPVGLAALRDAETGETRLFDTGSRDFRNQLHEAARKRVDSLERRLRRRGIDFIHVDAAGSVVDPLIAFFKMRERRSQR